MDDCLVCRSICFFIPDSHPYRITSTKFRINTVVSPDDGHIVARNTQTKKNCAPRWLYLQECTGMQVNKILNECFYSGLMAKKYNFYY